MMADFNRGFTIVEILLVLMLFAIVTGLSMPNFAQTFQSMALKSTVNDLMYVMRQAQSRSVTTGRLHQVKFSSDYHSCRINQQADITENSIDFVALKGRAGRPYLIDSTIQIRPTSDAINFQINGLMDPVDIEVCNSKKCLYLCTHYQRGAVSLLPSISFHQ